MSWLIEIVLNWFLKLIGQKVAAQVRDHNNHQAQVDQAHQDMHKTNELKPDSTAKDVDDAIDDSLKHF